MLTEGHQVIRPENGYGTAKQKKPCVMRTQKCCRQRNESPAPPTSSRERSKPQFEFRPSIAGRSPLTPPRQMTSPQAAKPQSESRRFGNARNLNIAIGADVSGPYVGADRLKAILHVAGWILDRCMANAKQARSKWDRRQKRLTNNPARSL